MVRAVGVGVLVAGWATAVALAQQPVVVQLPSYSVFSVATTVVVPTSGSVSLGSVGGGAWGASQWGFHPFRSRALGVGTAWRGVSVRAWVHPLHEMDRQVLARAARPDRSDAYLVAKQRGSSAQAGTEDGGSFHRRLAATMAQDRAYRGSIAAWRNRRQLAVPGD